jgi:hypothetical protein
MVDEIGETCSTHGRDKKCIQILGQKGIENSEDLGIVGMIILKRILGKEGGICKLDSSHSG